MMVLIIMIIITIITTTVMNCVGLGIQNLFLESQPFLRLFVAIFVALRLLSDPKEIPFVLKLSVSILSTRLLSIALVCLDTFSLFMTVFDVKNPC